MSAQTTELDLSSIPSSMINTTSNTIQTTSKDNYSLRKVKPDPRRVPEAVGDDTSSSLSDIEDRAANELLENNQDKSARPSDNDDTEAETERLEESPHKTRQHKNIILGLARVDDTSDQVLTESSNHPKQNGVLQAKRPTDKPGSRDIRFEDDPNDPTSDISSLGDTATEISQPASPTVKAGKKRKRSSRDLIDSEQDVTTESIKKVVAQLANHTTHPTERPGKDEPDTLISNDHVSNEKNVSNPSGAVSISQHPWVSTSPQLGKRRSRDDAASSVEAIESGRVNGGDAGLKNGSEDTKYAMDAISSNGEDLEVGDEAEAEIAARNEEENMKKKTAMDALGAIEKCFATLRDKLFDDRLAQLNEELTLLAQPNPSHPEYLAMMECIDHRRDENILHEKTLLRYKLGALERKSVAERAQHHSQYMQTARDIRDKTLEQVNKEWYQIQRERRSWDGDSLDYAQRFTTRRSHQIIRQTAYNDEVSVLSGVAKYVGFPAAPEISGARSGEIEEDLRSMGVTLNAQPTQQLLPQPNRINLSTPGIIRQRSAIEDQFFEQTPWANPQHHTHHQNRVPATHRQVSHHSRPHSPFVTPAALRRINEGVLPNGSASTITDIYPLQGSSVVPTPASNEQVFTSAPMAEVKTYTPSKSNGVNLPVTVGGTPFNRAIDEEDSQHESILAINSELPEKVFISGQRPNRITSPSQKTRQTILQMETPGALLPQSFRISGPHSNAEVVDQDRRHETPIHAIIPHQVSVMSSAELSK